MCSIFGMYKAPTSNPDLFEDTFSMLLSQAVERGRDAFGMVWFGDGQTEPNYISIPELGHHLASTGCSVYERSAIAQSYIKDYLDHNNIFEEMFAYDNVTLLANCRAIPTNEAHKNTVLQPYSDSMNGSKSTLWAVHNGTIANDQDWLAGTEFIDSKAIPLCYKENKSLDKLIGSVATALYIPKKDKLILARNYCPLQAVRVLTNNEDWVLFSSELDFNLLNKLDTRLENPTFSYQILDLPANSTLTLKYRDRKNDYSITLKQKLRTGTFFDKQVNEDSDKAVVILSGGLDSTTVARIACNNHKEVTLVHFLYGCKAQTREFQAVRDIHTALKNQFWDSVQVNLEIIELDFLKKLGGSTLTDPDKEVGQGDSAVEYAEDWVPFRNGLMLSMVAAYCDKNRIGSLYLGANLEEAGSYGDNQLEFFNLFQKAIALGSKMQTIIHNPLAHYMKHEIVALAHSIQAPVHLSWSCYHSNEFHCGDCGPCLLRKKAYQMNNIEDPIQYL